MKTLAWRSWLKFFGPSTAGLLVFFLPIEWGGRHTVALDALTKGLGALLGRWALTAVCAVCAITAFVSVGMWWRHARRRATENQPSRFSALMTEVFYAPPLWTLLRVVGGIAALCFWLQVGPGWLLADAITKNALESVGVVVFLIYIVSAACLPLVTDYGAMEFFGVLTRPFFAYVFRLPGRASLDAIASWVSSGPVAVLITLRQYESGYYTAREATFIATNFHIVSLPFTLVIAEVSGISQYYFSWYASLVIVGLTIALLVQRLPPWSRFPPTYVDGSLVSNAARDDRSRQKEAATNLVWRRAALAGVEAAQRGGSPVSYVGDVLTQMVRTVFGLIGACIGVVVVANLLLEYTPLFTWLSAPLIPVLQALGLAEAATAAPGIVIGFLDQFLTATVAARLHDPQTKFVLASLSVSQLIYMSNIGVMLLRSSLPVTLTDLLAMFAIRTVVALPLFSVAAKWIV